MSDIFISYARGDRPRARLLAEALLQHGWSVWWDRDIPPGQSFDVVIESALESARCVVVLWSGESVASDWVKTEAAEGARRGILVPALIEDVRLPLEFRRIQAANLSDWQGPTPRPEFDQFLRAVTQKLSGDSPKRPQPVPVVEAAPRVTGSRGGPAAFLICLGGLIAGGLVAGAPGASAPGFMFAVIIWALSVTFGILTWRRGRIPGQGKSSEATAYRPASAPSTSGDWRAELISKGWRERTIRVHLTHDRHTIEFRYHTSRFLNNHVIKVDGETAARGGHGFTSTIKMDFRITDGHQQLLATVVGSTTSWLDRIGTFRLSIAGRRLYEEG
jgi:hypothetical protein